MKYIMTDPKIIARRDKWLKEQSTGDHCIYHATMLGKARCYWKEDLLENNLCPQDCTIWRPMV